MKPVGVLSELDASEWPRTYSGEHLREIAFPLGGIGTGTVSLGGRGQLRDWEIFNHPDKGNDLDYCFPLIRTETADGKVQARVLEERIQTPYEKHGHGLPAGRFAGVPRLDRCTFIGAYPFAYVIFEDEKLPVEVTLEAFNPLVPGDPDASGLPAAVLRYHLYNPKRRPVRVSIAFVLQNPIGPPAGRRNGIRTRGAFRGLLLSNPSVPRDDPGYGMIALAVQGGTITTQRAWEAAPGRLSSQGFWHDFHTQGRLHDRRTGDFGKATVCASLTLGPRARKQVTFVIAWHFPNRTPRVCGFGAAEGHEDDVIGNYYATRFPDAWGVVEHLGRRLAGLEEGSRRFTLAVLQSTLPQAVVDAALNNVSTLRTNTCFRTAEGTFYAFEGCSDKRGCCTGNCTHVWNYEQTTAFLFPSLARSMRETEFLVSTDEVGRMSFRTKLPPGLERWGNAAADGQMGCVIRLYRDWKMCGDTDWLRRLWPAARRALEFCWVEGGWDADRDGVMEGVQHTTYDTEFCGPNPLCQGLYLAALRAAGQMAKAVGDDGFAEAARELFEKGSRWMDENLFNGRYYEQQVRPADPEKIADGLWLAKALVDPARPALQIEGGCLVDQLLGQSIAHMAGLGYLLKAANVKRAARSIFRYNRVHFSEHDCTGRTYALNDEWGLTICSWPRSQRPRATHYFFPEVWTGCEYQAAALLFYEGYLREGVRVVQDARGRYDGQNRNPWDECECGHHYARGMAAWGMLIALSGFEYNALTGEMHIMPRTSWTARTDKGLKSPTRHSRFGDGAPLALPEGGFRCFWSVPGAWGTVDLQARPLRAKLEVLSGRLRLRALRLPGEFAGLRHARCVRKGRRGVSPPSGVVAAGAAALPLNVEAHEGSTLIRLRRALSLSPGKVLILR